MGLLGLLGLLYRGPVCCPASQLLTGLSLGLDLLLVLGHWHVAPDLVDSRCQRPAVKLERVGFSDEPGALHWAQDTGEHDVI